MNLIIFSQKIVFLWKNFKKWKEILILSLIFISFFFVILNNSQIEKNKLLKNSLDFSYTGFDEAVYFKTYEKKNLPGFEVNSIQENQDFIFFNSFLFIDLNIKTNDSDYKIRIISLPESLEDLFLRYKSIFNNSLDNSSLNNTLNYNFFGISGQNYDFIEKNEGNSIFLNGTIQDNKNLSITGNFYDCIDENSFSFIRRIFIPDQLNSNLNFLFIDENNFKEILAETSLIIQGIILIHFNERNFNIINSNEIEDFFINPKKSFLLNATNCVFYIPEGIHNYFYNVYFHHLKSNLQVMIIIFLLSFFIYYRLLKYLAYEILKKNEDFVHTLFLQGENISDDNSLFWFYLILKLIVIMFCCISFLMILWILIGNYLIFKTISFFQLSFLIINYIPISFLSLLLFLIAFRLSYINFYYNTQLNIKNNDHSNDFIKKGYIKFWLTSFLIMGVLLLIFSLNQSYYRIYGYDHSLIAYISDFFLPFLILLIFSIIFTKYLLEPNLHNISLLTYKIFNFLSKKSIYNKKIVYYWNKQKAKLKFNTPIIFLLIFSITFFSFYSIQQNYITEQKNIFVKEDVRLILEVENEIDLIQIQNYFSVQNYSEVQWIYEYNIIDTNSFNNYILLSIPNYEEFFNNTEIFKQNSSFEGLIINKNSGNLNNQEFIEIQEIGLNFSKKFVIMQKMNYLSGCFSELKDHNIYNIVYCGNQSTLENFSVRKIHLFLTVDQSFSLRNFLNDINFNSDFKLVDYEIQENNNYSLSNNYIFSYFTPLLVFSIILYVFQFFYQCKKGDINFYDKIEIVLNKYGMDPKLFISLKFEYELIFWSLFVGILFSIIAITNIICFNLISIKWLTLISFPIKFRFDFIRILCISSILLGLNIIILRKSNKQ